MTTCQRCGSPKDGDEMTERVCHCMPWSTEPYGQPPKGYVPPDHPPVAPCGCAPGASRLELVEISLEPEGVRAATFRCGACGNFVVSRRKPMRFPLIPEELFWGE